MSKGSTSFLKSLCENVSSAAWSMRFCRSRVRNNAVNKLASQEAQDAFLCPEAGRTLHGVSGQPRHPLCKACPSSKFAPRSSLLEVRSSKFAPRSSPLKVQSWSKCASPSTRRHAPGSPRVSIRTLQGTTTCVSIRTFQGTTTCVSISYEFSEIEGDHGRKCAFGN